MGSDKETPGKSARKKGAVVQSKNRDMGDALRTIYQKAVDEAVPDEMMALLKKLG